MAQSASEASDDAPVARRSILKWITGAIGALLGVGVAAPVAAVVGSPIGQRIQSGGEEPITVAEIDKLPEGVPVRAQVVADVVRDAWSRFERVALGAVWLVRRGARVSALSTTCPHAGCFVDFEAKKNCFSCPCHGSTFDLDGNRTGGPSPRAMDSLEVEQKAGKVLVRFQRFRQARATREPV